MKIRSIKFAPIIGFGYWKDVYNGVMNIYGHTEYAESLDTVAKIPVQAIHTQRLTAMEYGPYFLWRILPEGFLISMN